jgi:hypothetical protein
VVDAGVNTIALSLKACGSQLAELWKAIDAGLGGSTTYQTPLWLQIFAVQLRFVVIIGIL